MTVGKIEQLSNEPDPMKLSVTQNRTIMEMAKERDQLRVDLERLRMALVDIHSETTIVRQQNPDPDAMRDRLEKIETRSWLAVNPHYDNSPTR